jgi:hypothetical protein
MHEWQEEVAQIAMHYAICIFDHKHTGRAPFPAKLDAFSKVCIITICIITISTVFPKPIEEDWDVRNLRILLE